MKVYIAGPMTKFREANYNFPEFFIAQALLEMMGHTVFNPARMDIQDGKVEYVPSEGRVVPSPSFTLADAMRRDIKVISECDAIVLLEGWETSTGAPKELRVATQDFGMPAYHLVRAKHVVDGVTVEGWPILVPYVSA